jgi:transcriptional regulator with XRE-family HTH domain
VTGHRKSKEIPLSSLLWFFYLVEVRRMTVPSQLRRARFERSLTQCDLMLKTGIPQSRISLIEKGYYPPKSEEAKKIARALGMRVSDLFSNGGGKR